jgi:signal transduction histidine kinase
MIRTNPHARFLQAVSPLTAMATPSGLPILGDLQHGSHIGQFYWDQHDLLETLVPFFATGLRERERCIWVCSQPLCAAEARSALANAVPELDVLERSGQISILDHHEWYTTAGHLNAEQVIDGWLIAERDALAAGYTGLRINGNTFWLTPEQWQQFTDYEARAHAAFRDRKIVALCSYPLSKCHSDQVVDVLHNHGASLVRNGSQWNVVHEHREIGIRESATASEPDRLRAELAHAKQSLAKEVARRQVIEAAYTRARDAREHLVHERQRAELASRAKDEFLAMLGHELRNPLSPILTATQLMRLRGEEVFEKERTVIERQCKHMIRLVDDLLDVSRITRGKVDLRRRPVEISEVIAQAVELASPAMEERAHRLTVDVPSNGMVVHGDPARLAQVFSNLLNNAAKYTPHGGAIHVAVHTHDSMVVTSVRDTGIGIDPKLLAQVFELFVQARQGIDRAAGGLGLGLAIAKTLVELHGGTIAARSEGRGRGAELIVTLPRFANTRPLARNCNSGAFQLAPQRPVRVLVVDDNEDAAFLFSEALKKLGHKVDVAHDGPSALAVARQSHPEIAFLDIGLPVMDGYELGRRLKELDIDPPKLVAVTGYGHSSDRVRSREAGFDLHLVKPIDLAAIQDALAKLLS